MSLILVIVYAFIITSFVRGHKKCPYENCKCESNGLTCWNIPDMEEMESVMEYVVDKSTKIKKFYLKDTKLPALPDKAFSGTELHQLKFENVELPFIVPPINSLSPFAGLEKLEEIHLYKVSYLYNWNWTMFSNLKDLHTFKAEDSLFVYVSESFSALKSHLKHLTLKNCEIVWIENGAFASFSELSNLILSHNRISSFPRSTLPSPAKNLVRLDLSDNMLEDLTNDFFSNMPLLSSVDLNKNRLTMLSAELIKNIKRGFTVYIEDNPFICNCTLLWICNLPDDGIIIDYGKTKCAHPSNHQIKDMCNNKSAKCSE